MDVRNIDFVFESFFEAPIASCAEEVGVFAKKSLWNDPCDAVLGRADCHFERRSFKPENID